MVFWSCAVIYRVLIPILRYIFRSLLGGVLCYLLVKDPSTPQLLPKCYLNLLVIKYNWL